MRTESGNREARVRRSRLRRDLRSIGLQPGMTVLVHCSLRNVGTVSGGAEALRDALLDVLGREGTLVVPTQTRSTSQTSAEFRAGVAGLDPDQAADFAERLPGFDCERSPSEGMGVLAESVRLHPDARRSGHPITSFAAVGQMAEKITAVHSLPSFLGDHSPLDRLYEYDARVLLVGVPYNKCTAFHLGEARVVGTREFRCKEGDVWRSFTGPAHDDTDFGTLGAMFDEERADRIHRGKIGHADSLLFPLTTAVDFAQQRIPLLRPS